MTWLLGGAHTDGVGHALGRCQVDHLSVSLFVQSLANLLGPDSCSLVQSRPVSSSLTCTFSRSTLASTVHTAQHQRRQSSATRQRAAERLKETEDGSEEHDEHEVCRSDRSLCPR